ncbi:SCP-like protein [Ancylostoma ceylanicum]|uniref:SCP-like protein n=1 Tax=Ancylostoma ceylanicum TaxID=53326 RepID=A0A0D6LET4_9BILA|nr:SCP-like protein [Ancylostoma ceylanicum]
MEKQAQDSIATCSGDFGPFENMGQNINSFRGFSDPRAQINSTLNSWWGVAKKYGVTDKENKYVGHLYTFANMVFAETTKLGCAYKICGKAMSITCLYNAIGYYDDTPMWETGKACTKGTDCTTHPNSACDAGLCVYDCTVEASAIRYSKKCLFKHSAKTERKGLNENLYKSGGIKFDKASQLWWDELKEFGVGQANILTPQLWTRPKKPIGHYTQMAWEKSYKLGCAVEHCPSFTLGVCHYGPGGNIIGQPIYTVGKPCTRDSDCPGSYTCSVAEGLCNVV